MTHIYILYYPLWFADRNINSFTPIPNQLCVIDCHCAVAAAAGFRAPFPRPTMMMIAYSLAAATGRDERRAISAYNIV